MSYLDALEKLRKKVVKHEDGLKLLLASFVGSKQQKDIEKRTDLIHDYFRVKIDVKGIDDKEREKLGLGKFDPSDVETTHKGLTGEFDMPLWALIALGGKLTDYNKTFIYQLNACNLKCPYCYVDDSNKRASLKHGARFFTIPEIVDVFEEERKDQVLNKFRPSGGEPSLAVEQWLYSLHELRRRGLEKKVYLQADTNLTTGHFIDRLEEREEIPKSTLSVIGHQYNNFGLLTSFKGTDPENYHKNAGVGKKLAKELFDEQFYTFKKYIEAGIDAYPFLYDPNPDSLESFLERLSREVKDERVYLKTWAFRLKVYDPVKDRFSKKHKDVEEYEKSLQENFERTKEKLQEVIEKKFGIPYQMLPRPSIRLR